MASPADELAQAIEDVERIARTWYEEARVVVPWREAITLPWDDLVDEQREAYREITRRLLRHDIIRIGQRPSGERPMDGQTSLTDSLPLDG